MNFQTNSGQVGTFSKWRRLPKVELHRHLECAVRFSTLLELAEAHGLPVPKNEKAQRSAFLVEEPMTDLESVLNKFTVLQNILTSEEILARLTYEVIQDADHEGIKILELRFAPTFVQGARKHLTIPQIFRAIRRGAEMAREFPVAVGFLCIFQRILSPAIAHEVLDAALEEKDLFVGVDLADNEVGFDSKPFLPVFQRARDAGLSITIHAGEADIPEASRNVKEAIEILGATRIGHGLQIYKDPFVMNLVKSKGIPLELCPTSNWLTQAVPSHEAHPIRKLMESGVPITINSDDPGIFGIDLVHEYDLLEKIHHFKEEEFNRCNDVAAQASFLPLLKKQKYWPRPIHSLRSPMK